MMKKKKMISISKILLTILILIALTGCSKSAPEELGNIDEVEWKYEDAYYLRTEYKDQYFEVFSDFEWINEGDRFVMYTVTPNEGKFNAASSMYHESFKPHSVIQEIMPEELYRRVTGGKTIFVDSFTVTTVITPVNEENGPLACVYTYVERDSVTDIDALVRKSLFMTNSDEEKRSFDQDEEAEYNNFMKACVKWEE